MRVVCAVEWKPKASTCSSVGIHRACYTNMYGTRYLWFVQRRSTPFEYIAWAPEFVVWSYRICLYAQHTWPFCFANCFTSVQSHGGGNGDSITPRACNNVCTCTFGFVYSAMLAFFCWFSSVQSMLTEMYHVHYIINMPWQCFIRKSMFMRASRDVRNSVQFSYARLHPNT